MKTLLKRLSYMSAITILTLPLSANVPDHIGGVFAGGDRSSFSFLFTANYKFFAGFWDGDTFLYNSADTPSSGSYTWISTTQQDAFDKVGCSDNAFTFFVQTKGWVYGTSASVIHDHFERHKPTRFDFGGVVTDGCN
jgi:hypothetical protein